ncbi:MAG TPA: AraC family transcriptional regulator [Candidatus Eisenbergiella intestinipullorum]|nr:AraC family transcriptional regulator [Candidatus Eisenbergiella intestinipullorum]
MKYCIYHSSYPLVFSSCGNLISDNGFLHPKRNIDSFVLLLVHKGTLYITQGEKEYVLQDNQFLILFPHTLHYGTHESIGHLSYYWTHFYISDPEYQMSGTFQYKDQLLPFQNILQLLKGHVVLPETGLVPSAGHSQLLFLQLMDIACREHYKATFKCHYALSLLMLELCSETLSANILRDQDIPPRLSECIDWIQLHYNQPLTALQIASRFHYNPAYLTGLFKKYTGYSLIQYINHTRISAAKNLLSNQEQTIESIARQCGFSDTKYFYRIFKKEAHSTPREYRNAFHYKKLVN